MGVVNITIRTPGLDAPIDGVLVSVYDSENVFVTSGLTDTVGEVQFALDGSVDGITYNIFLSKEGWSFPPQNHKVIVATDPPVPFLFEYPGELGTDHTLVAIIVKDDRGVLVNGVLVQVHDANGNFITSGITGTYELGVAEFLLSAAPSPGLEYRVYLSKAETQMVPSDIQRIMVISDYGPAWGEGAYGDGGYGGQGIAYPLNSFEFTCHQFVLPEATDPALCRITGFLNDVTLNPVPNLEIRFSALPGFDMQYMAGLMPPDLPITPGRIVVKEVITKADAKGYIDVQLQRGCNYDTHIYGFEHPVSIAQTIKVPDAAGVRLEDVIFPYITDVTYSPEGPLALQVGDTLSVEVAAMSSDGFPPDVPAMTFVDFQVDDSTIINLTFEDYKLHIIAMSTGTTFIRAVRRPNSYAPRFGGEPDLPQLDIGVT
jgi:hypothetical protein